MISPLMNARRSSGLMKNSGATSMKIRAMMRKAIAGDIPDVYKRYIEIVSQTIHFAKSDIRAARNTSDAMSSLK